MDNFNSFFDDQRQPQPEHTPVYHTPSHGNGNKNSAALIISIVAAVLMTVLVIVNVIVLATLKDSIAKEYAENISDQMRAEYREAIQDSIKDKNIVEEVKDSVTGNVIDALENSIGEIADRYASSVARIYMYQSTGTSQSSLATAFLITDTDANGAARYMITNAHCATYVKKTQLGFTTRATWATYSKILAYFEDENGYYNCEVVAYGSFTDNDNPTVAPANDQADLALLRITSAQQPSNEAHPSLQLASSDFTPRGTQIALIGNPEGVGSMNSITTGTISQTGLLIPSWGNGEFILTDATLNGGNSGGPMITKSGVVVGVSESKLVDESIENMGFAVSAGTLYEFIEWISDKSYVGVAGHQAYDLNLASLCKFAYGN